MRSTRVRATGKTAIERSVAELEPEFRTAHYQASPPLQRRRNGRCRSFIPKVTVSYGLRTRCDINVATFSLRHCPITYGAEFASIILSSNLVAQETADLQDRKKWRKIGSGNS